MYSLKKIHLIPIFAALMFLAVFFWAPKAQAAVTDNVWGWAWSDGIGWISLNNCDNPTLVSPNCTGPDYGIKYDSATGNLTGYGWSDSIGWVQFGGLSGFPARGSNANINLTTGAVTGWARAIAGAGRTDGWDGWISLSGTGYAPIFNISTGIGSGFAWGSNVVGWIDFTNARIQLPVQLCPAYTWNCGGWSPCSNDTQQRTCNPVTIPDGTSDCPSTRPDPFDPFIETRNYCTPADCSDEDLNNIEKPLCYCSNPSHSAESVCKKRPKFIER